jgi:hypothetical protein
MGKNNNYQTNLHPRPNIELEMGYFTLLMYKTVINQVYKPCLLIAGYHKSWINEISFPEIHTNSEKNLIQFNI